MDLLEERRDKRLGGDSTIGLRKTMMILGFGCSVHILTVFAIGQCRNEAKGIPEEAIEQAFIESYRLLCQNSKDVLDEFMARTEEVLSAENASKQLEKAEKNIEMLKAKREKYTIESA